MKQFHSNEFKQLSLCSSILLLWHKSLLSGLSRSLSRRSSATRSTGTGSLEKSRSKGATCIHLPNILFYFLFFQMLQIVRVSERKQADQGKREPTHHHHHHLKLSTSSTQWWLKGEKAQAALQWAASPMCLHHSEGTKWSFLPSIHFILNLFLCWYSFQGHCYFYSAPVDFVNISPNLHQSCNIHIIHSSTQLVWDHKDS